MFGTLTIIDWNGEDWYEIKTNYEVSLMITRLIPSHCNVPLRVRVQPENTQLLRMVMSEYPLKILSDKWEDAQRDIIKLEELANEVSKLDYIEPSQANFVGELMPFQKQGLDFLLKTQGNTLLTDEMGLGKTIETLAFISKNPQALPVVIVAPLTTLINWSREIERFLKLEHYEGDQKRLDQSDVGKPIVHLIRSGETQPLPLADFYIVNYELVLKRYYDIAAVNPKIVVFDEIQYLRNDDTKRYQSCKGLVKLPSVRHRIGLSGTPIYNRGLEMYNIAEIIKPGTLGERQEFIRRYCMSWNSRATDEDGKKGLFALLSKTIMIRRRKMDVLQDLPDKVRMKQVIQIDKDLYEKKLDELMEKVEVAKEELAQFAQASNEEKEGLFQLNKRIREMTIAERQIAGLAKAPFVVSYLAKLLKDYEEEKFVVFCHHLSVHEILMQGLWLYKPVQVVGGQADHVRQAAIDKFQNDKDCRVIVCGLRAGNLGINLTSSCYVIFAELDWSPSVHRQAEDRLHRIGQKNKVFAHYLEGEGTFDEILSQVLLKKTLEINSVMGDKMERINNQKAIEFLQAKFNTIKPTTTFE